MNCQQCSSVLTKENFPNDYTGEEKDKLHCAVCGIWTSFSESKKVSKSMKGEDQ